MYKIMHTSTSIGIFSNLSLTYICLERADFIIDGICTCPERTIMAILQMLFIHLGNKYVCI
jgi:hypothetical protein